MQIHQVGHFVSAMLIGGGGLFIVAGRLCLGAKSHVFRDDAERRQLALGLVFLLMGLHHLSSAFDLPHQESVRTQRLDWVTVPLAVVLLGCVLYSQRRQRAESERMPA